MLSTPLLAALCGRILTTVNIGQHYKFKVSSFKLQTHSTICFLSLTDFLPFVSGASLGLSCCFSEALSLPHLSPMALYSHVNDFGHYSHNGLNV